jgi:hypothetical protein
MIEAAILPGAVAGVLFGVIIYRPLFGTCLFLFANPLIVGVARGEFGVVLRPNEVLLLFILVAIGVRILLLMLSGRYRPAPFDGMDAALLGLVITGSVLPVLWRDLRSLPLSMDDIFYAIVLVKYYALFRLFRGTVVDEVGVATCLRVSLIAASVVAMIAILEAFRLFGVAEVLTAYYDQPFGGSEGLVSGRATSTIASAFGLADLMIISLVTALALRRVAVRGRWLLSFGIVLFLSGCMVTGTISGYIGLAVGLLAFGALTGSLQRLVPAGMVAGGVAAATFWPVLGSRLAEFSQPSGMPISWTGRWANLEQFFLPDLSTGANWLFGVRPAPRVPAPEAWRDWVYIESGYVWLLWIGGVPFLLAFLFFVVVALRRLGRVARVRCDAVGAAALAGCCSVFVIAVLMLFDPHLTIRGGADIFFPLLALSLAPARVGQAALEPAQIQLQSAVPSARGRLACG